MNRAVLYVRISKRDQTTANQERELREVAGTMGYDIVKSYQDHGISGARRAGRSGPHSTRSAETLPSANSIW